MWSDFGLCINYVFQFCFHQFYFCFFYLYLTYLSFVFMNLVTCKQVFKREGGGREGNTWQTGMKPRKFEKVPTSVSFEFSCFKNCLECDIYTSLLPPLRLYFRLFWPTWRKIYGQCCLPVSDRLTESKGLLMTSAGSVCENNLPFSIRIKLSPTPILSPKICNWLKKIPHEQFLDNNKITFSNLPHNLPKTFVFILDRIIKQLELVFANCRHLPSATHLSS